MLHWFFSGSPEWLRCCIEGWRDNQLFYIYFFFIVPDRVLNAREIHATQHYWNLLEQLDYTTTGQTITRMYFCYLFISDSIIYLFIYIFQDLQPHNILQGSHVFCLWGAIYPNIHSDAHRSLLCQLTIIYIWLTLTILHPSTNFMSGSVGHSTGATDSAFYCSITEVVFFNFWIEVRSVGWSGAARCLWGLTGLCGRLAAPDGTGTLGCSTLAFASLHHPAFCGQIQGKHMNIGMETPESTKW